MSALKLLQNASAVVLIRGTSWTIQMNWSLRKPKALADAWLLAPQFGADGNEADDAINAAIEQLVALRGMVASPPTSLPPPAPSKSIDIRDRVIPAVLPDTATWYAPIILYAVSIGLPMLATYLAP
jgi:hypothetical protein